MGCYLAAESIRDLGLTSYYLDRSEINAKAELPTELTELTGFDHEATKAQFITQVGDKCQAELSVVGLRCAACSWLIEKRLSDIPEVERVAVNLTTQRMQLTWDDAQKPISDIIHAIDQLGYKARPYQINTHNERLRGQLKSMLMRLIVAGIGAMQTMTFAVAMYFGFYQGMDVADKTFLRWVSLIVSVPVFFYAGFPFYKSAWSSIKASLSAKRFKDWQINMDVPVSLALVITFFVSAYAVIFGGGETYFDSVSMFIFFLLSGRYVELRARMQASGIANNLIAITPNLVSRLMPSGATERVSVYDVAVGEHILVEQGQSIPTDGVLLGDKATVSLALVTGESTPVSVAKGDMVFGGAQNYGDAFTMQVSQTIDSSTLATIDKLVSRSQGEKPKLAQQADRLASWFVVRVLLLAAVVFTVWSFVDPSKAVWTTVAVLVATCPCALSLATPIALTVATNQLAKQGFLVTRPHVLESLTQLSDVVFDKTGTLTQSKLLLESIQPLERPLEGKTSEGEALAQSGADAKEISQHHLQIASSLEQGSSHPIAKALLREANQAGLTLLSVSDTEAAQGGISGMVQGERYKIGNASFVGINPHAWAADAQHDAGQVAEYMQVFLVRVGEGVGLGAGASVVAQGDGQPDGKSVVPLARFEFATPLRQSSAPTIAALKKMTALKQTTAPKQTDLSKQVDNAQAQPIAHNLVTHMLTGDTNAEALKLAQNLGLDHAKHGLSPEQKLAEIACLQAGGNKVMMVGDGINDAPVLAKADVSVAMASAADLAQVSADSIIINDDLSAIVTAFDVAHKTQRIIKQNLAWAVVYNAIVLIPAALGYVPPWLAALGMSFSSLVVVLNALRLAR